MQSDPRSIQFYQAQQTAQEYRVPREKLCRAAPSGARDAKQDREVASAGTRRGHTASKNPPHIPCSLHKSRNLLNYSLNSLRIRFASSVCVRQSCRPQRGCCISSP